MKVKELIDILKDCREDVEVYFEAGNDISIVKSVFEVATRTDTYHVWDIKRVILSDEED